MARLIDLDEVGFEEQKPAIKFFGKKFYVNKSAEASLRVKLLEKKYVEELKNNARSKKAEEKEAEIHYNHYKNIFKVMFGEEQAKEIFDYMPTDEQFILIMRAVSAIMSDEEFKLETTEQEEKEKKTSLESADTTS